VIVAIKLDQPRPRYCAGQIAASLDTNRAVAAAMQDERRRDDAGQQRRTSVSRNDSSRALIAPLDAVRKIPAHQCSAEASPTRLGAKVAISAGPP
jgi:hypothetical protein